MGCSICKFGLILTTDYKVGTYSICQECGNETVEYAQYCCNKPDYKPSRKYADDFIAQMEDDDYTVWNQCQNCGETKGTAIKKSKYPKKSLTLFSHQLREDTVELQIKFTEKIKEINNRDREEKAHKYWYDYNEYLNSDEWKKKRELIFNRDNNICQSCLKNPATEVHHLDGQFRFNEPLFSLKAVCSECHEIITQIERGNQNTGKIKHR